MHAVTDLVDGIAPPAGGSSGQSRVVLSPHLAQALANQGFLGGAVHVGDQELRGVARGCRDERDGSAAGTSAGLDGMNPALHHVRQSG